MNLELLVKGGKEQMDVLVLKQKLMGLLFLLIGIVSVPICDMDATFALLAVPAGLFLIFAKKIYIEG